VEAVGGAEGDRGDELEQAERDEEDRLRGAHGGRDGPAARDGGGGSYEGHR
jgi:hypothetical protein